MKFEKLVQSTCWELGRQTAKFSFATLSIIVLVLINNNIHQLVSCLGEIKTPISVSQSKVNCSSTKLNVLEASLCTRGDAKTLIVSVENEPFCIYSNESLTRVVQFIKACSENAPTCPIRYYGERQKCQYLAYYDDIRLCLNRDKSVQFGTFCGLQLPEKESITLINYLRLLEV